MGALAADALSVEALARLQLSARREGLEVRLSGLSRELGQLIEFCGLAGVLGLEASRQAE